MKILITAATGHELLAAQQAATATVHDITFAVTGIGIAATAYHTAKLLLAEPCEFALNIGIAGSFTPRLPVGSVACAVKEYFGDSGVQTPAGFSSLFDEQLLNENTFPFVDGALNADMPPAMAGLFSEYPPATGVTLQTATGEQQRIDGLLRRFQPDIETMESAAFFYVCLSEKVPFAALRAISNKVEVRNKAAWNIPLAIQNLETAVRRVVGSLQLQQAVHKEP
ncbi:MAG: futalosine hydrolase [Prevotellaceae bacterium]|jgi:futalosine hydrolase|nr:futalosine hydrolase [Prevotellaceae bacterium]